MYALPERSQWPGSALNAPGPATERLVPMQEQDKPLADLRALFVEYLRGQAHWRELKADEWPDDTRNLRCAQHLYAFAAHVERLPETNENLRLLAAIQEPYNLEVFTPREEAGRLVSRFGFDNGTGDATAEDFDAFLVELASVEVSDAVEDEWELADPDDERES